MVTYSKLKPGTIEQLPLGEVLYANIVQTEESLTKAAMIGVSSALGNHPELLNADRDYFNFVATYVSDVLVPYAEKAAAPQLALLSLGGQVQVEQVLEGFLPELSKVRKVVIPDEAAASLILNEPERAGNFFLALIAATAIVCRRRPALGRAFGLRRSLSGRWRRRRTAHWDPKALVGCLSSFAVRVAPLGVAVAVLVLGWESVVLRILGSVLVLAAVWWALPVLSFLPALGRFGVHAGTARWATTLYSALSKLAEYNHAGHVEVLRDMIVRRYRHEPLNRSRERLLSYISDSTGLFELVLLVLGEEAGLWDNEPRWLNRVARDVAAVMSRSSLPPAVLWGDCPPTEAVAFAQNLQQRLGGAAM